MPRGCDTGKGRIPGEASPADRYAAAMVTAAMVAQYTTSEPDLGEILWNAYVPQIVGGLIVLIGAICLVKLGSSRPSKTDQLPIPEWYPDPWGQPYERWWNGVAWTPAIRPYPWTGPHGPPGTGPMPHHDGPGLQQWGPVEPGGQPPGRRWPDA